MRAGSLSQLRPTHPPPALGIVVAATFFAAETLLVYPLSQLATLHAAGMVYLIGVLVVSTVWGLKLGLPTLVVSAAAFAYYLTLTGPFTFESPTDASAFVIFLVVGLLVSFVAELARSRAVETYERRREAELSAELGRLLLRTGDLRAALPAASRCLAEELELPSAAIELEPVAGDERRVALPLRDGATPLGTLLVPADLPGHALRRLRERVVPSLQTLLRAARDREAMVSSLEASRAQLAASRARIVAASDEARRRIERDLHDGTQQRLVALGLELRAAEGTVPPGLEELEARLSHATKALASVVEDLQEVTRGIHPAVLSTGGLGPALRTLTRRSAVPVQLDVRTAERVPERVEVAAYYVVSEALTNVAKHAGASLVRIELEVEDGILLLSIRDDGVGGADPGRGSGLMGLRDRVEALGGRIEIASPPGSGTSLLVRIPIEGS